VESDAARIKNEWRKAQRTFGASRTIVDLTEYQIWPLIRILVLMLNQRDDPKAVEPLLYARALRRALGWTEGTLQPRLQRLESFGWVYTHPRRVIVAGKRMPVLCYGVTVEGEAVATVWSQYLQGLLTITPRERQRA